MVDSKQATVHSSHTGPEVGNLLQGKAAFQQGQLCTLGLVCRRHSSLPP